MKRKVGRKFFSFVKMLTILLLNGFEDKTRQPKRGLKDYGSHKLLKNKTPKGIKESKELQINMMQNGCAEDI